MAKTRKINLSLPEKLADYAESQVESGHFNSMGDLIRYAVRKLQEQDQSTSGFDLDAFIQAGIDSGVSEQSGPEAHKELRRRIRGMSKSHASK